MSIWQSLKHCSENSYMKYFQAFQIDPDIEDRIVRQIKGSWGIKIPQKAGIEPI